MEKLSAVIITFNEEKNIGRCIRSLEGVADEIVVLDSFSTDRTREICEKHKVKFHTAEFAGYIEQKNKALTHAAYPYILSLDADETLSESLTASILQVKKNWDADGYTFNRLTNYCGKWIRHCGWYPDRKLRLFDARKGRWTGLNPHDIFIMKDSSVVKHLKGDLLHYSYYTVDEHYRQAEHFSSLSAKAKFEQGKKAPLIKVWISPVVKFLKCYLLQKGFLDGRAGWHICTISAKESYQKYRKLRVLYQQQRKH
jgi:glycosyltransferase involved in cell wall biosynthesis